MTAPAARAGAAGPGPRADRPAAPSRLAPDLLLAAALFALAAGGRVWGVQWSLPYVGHVDEPKIVDAAVRIIKTGDLNPGLFIWPSLVIYLQTLIDRVVVLLGTWTGTGPPPAALPDSNHIFALVPGLYFWGRTASAVIGAGAVAGCYALGRAIWDRAAGLIAALLLLTSPLHVEYSHYLVTDVTMGACGLLVLAAAWHLAAQHGARAALLAGAAVGLCAAAKYNGVYVGLPVALAWAIAWRRAGPAQGRAARWLILAGGMGLAGALVFLAANPYLLLDWRDWSRSFVFQVNAYVPATTFDQARIAFGKQVAALWASDGIFLAAGVAGSLVLLGDALRLRRLAHPTVRAACLLLPFPLAYTLLMSRFTEVYERNLIVTLPCLALAAAYALTRLARAVSSQRSAVSGQLTVEDTPHPPPLASRFTFHVSRFTFHVYRPTRYTVLVLLLAVLLVAEPARRSLNFDAYMALPESRNQAAAWLQDALQAGHRAAVELHPWQLCAPPPYACPDPDVYATNAPLTVHPPAWYAARGYDYVLLVGRQDAIVGDPTQEGPRAGDQLAAFQALPVVAEWPGDRGGGKGPDVWVVRTAAAAGGPAGATPSQAQFGTVAALWGYALAPLPTAAATWDPAAGPPPGGAYRAGGAAGVQLYWRALPGARSTPGNWTVGLHLIDSTGATVAQVDVVPISNGRLRPVATWYPDEFLAGTYNIPLPPALAPGAYRLTLALYDSPAGRAQPIAGAAPAGATTLELATLAVTR